MSSIGSNRNTNQTNQDLVYQELADKAADAASGQDPDTGEKAGKLASKAKMPTGKGTGVGGTGAGKKANLVEAKPGEGPQGGPVGKTEPMSRTTVAPRDEVVLDKGGRRSLTDKEPAASALPAVDKTASTQAPKGAQELSGLVSATDTAMGSQSVKDALSVLTRNPAPSDADYKKALSQFADGMQAMGRSWQTPAALSQLFTATSYTDQDRNHMIALAGQVGLDVTASAAAAKVSFATIKPADEVESAKQQLLTDLASDKVDAATITADTQLYKAALQKAGQGDSIDAKFADLVNNGNLSEAGKASVFAAAAKLGISMPGSMDDAKKDGEAAAAAAKGQRNDAKAMQMHAEQRAVQAQQAAQAAQAAQQSSNNGGGRSSSGGSGQQWGAASGSAAKDMRGSTGDITNLAAASGTVKGDFKMGVLPDYDNGSSGGLGGFVSRTGVRPAQVGGYVDARADGSFDTGAADRWIKEAIDGKVPTVSLSISAWGTGKLSEAQVSGIKAAVDKGRAAGIEVDIRFGYEMNYGGGGGEQGGRVNNGNNTAAFKQQWAQVAAVVNPDRNSTPPAKMVWSPNVWSGGVLPYADWLPEDTSTIDVVGLDYYHTTGQEISLNGISSVIDPLYAISQKINKPFIFGETGITGNPGNDGDEKTKWLNLLSSPELREKYPLYQGFYWFDYVKGNSNFSLSQDSSAAAPFRNWYNDTFKTGGAS